MTRRNLPWPSKVSHLCRRFRALSLFRVLTNHRLSLQSLMFILRSNACVNCLSWLITKPSLTTRVTSRKTSRIRPFSGGSSASASTQSKRLSWSTSLRWTIAGARAAFQTLPRGSASAIQKSINGSTIEEKRKRLKDHKIKTALDSKACKSRGKSERQLGNSRTFMNKSSSYIKQLSI